jgi:hypothetical protein
MSNSFPPPHADDLSDSAAFPPAMMLAPSSVAVARARLRAITAGSQVTHLPATWTAERDRPLPPLPPDGVLLADQVLWPADTDQLARLVRQLGDRRVLVFLEPTADIGWRRSLHRLGRPLWRRSLGHDFDGDVAAALRATGITVTDVVRFNVGPAGLFSWAYGRAQWIG